MGEILLSICIPTWNRKNDLGRLLGNIRKESKGMEGQIEVCVSDNGSTDGTKEFLEQERKSAPFQTNFFFSPQNNGFDVNVLRVLRMGKGKWLWIFGDDDIINPGGLKALIQHLSQMPGDISVVYPNHTYILEGQDLSEAKPFDTPEKIANKDSSSRSLVLFPEPYLSRIIMRRDLFFSINQKNLDRYVGSVESYMWAQRFIGFMNPQMHSKSLPEPIFLCIQPKPRLHKLSDQLIHSFSAHKTYRTFVWQNKFNPQLYSKYPVFIIKMLRTVFFPFLHITCEREFRKNAKGEASLSFFMKSFGILGFIPFLYREFIWILPDPILHGFLMLMLRNNENYEKWKFYWEQDMSKISTNRSWLSG